MRLLIICPIPLDYTTCRGALSLRDGQPVLGCRSAEGALANVDIMALQSGPAKARAASATVAGITDFHPDLVVDTGTCGALDGGLIPNAIVLALSCVEFDISGSPVPQRIIPEMALPSSFSLLSRKDADALTRSAVELGKDMGLHVRTGVQACGELLIQSTELRETLRALTGALTANWETAGVFIAALRARIPPLSLRVVTDMGDEDSLKEFKRNARKGSQELYRYLGSLIESGWLASFHAKWRCVAGPQVERMPQMVLP